jgi:DNA-nicking Smr family endonuclease
MPPRTRALTTADRDQWETYARTLSPLPGRPIYLPPASTPALAPPVAFPHAPPAKIKPKAHAKPLDINTQPGGIDTATWQRLRTGKLPVLRKLDLHGMTAQRAFLALVTFLKAAHTEQIRCVEVITGRGSGETGGVIRRELPFWLNLPEIRPLVLAAVHPHALNPGSVRLILRRIR